MMCLSLCCFAYILDKIASQDDEALAHDNLLSLRRKKVVERERHKERKQN